MSYDYTKRFKEITENMADLYAKKNADYGNSFANSVEEWGLVAGAARLSDKFNRMKEIIKGHKPLVESESLYDTCIDGACYFIMMAMEIEKMTQPVDISANQYFVSEMKDGEHS